MSTIILNEASDEFKAIKKAWEVEAKKMTIEELPAFLTKLTTEYQHDYGTICHAMSIAGIAAMWAVDHSPQGSITGFQAGAIMWEFIRSWNFSTNKTGLKIIDYDNLLFPQYEDKFEKTISQEVWNQLQKEARINMDDALNRHMIFLDDMKQYKKDLSAFVAKYPDYYDREEYYNTLSMGTGDDWDKEKEKKESGFEFAPHKPYDMFNHNVYDHWESIVNGTIPFGYKIGE